MRTGAIIYIGLFLAWIFVPQHILADVLLYAGALIVLAMAAMPIIYILQQAGSRKPNGL